MKNLPYRFSFVSVFKENKAKLLTIFLLIFLESISFLFLPLFIGHSIDGLLNDNYQQLIILFMLSAAILILGTCRRFFDTRVYSKIYQQTACKIVYQTEGSNESVSKISARCSFLNELVNFLERDFYEIISLVIGIIGILVILFFIKFHIFLACITIALLFLLVYSITSRRIYNLNKDFNDQIEQQVDVIKSKNKRRIDSHFKGILRWNVKLSDMETINSFFIFASMIVLLPYTIWVSVKLNSFSYGEVLSTIMYVYEYITLLITLPFFVERFIRFKEIDQRFKNS